jgi:hypothetical protein
MALALVRLETQKRDCSRFELLHDTVESRMATETHMFGEDLSAFRCASAEVVAVRPRIPQRGLVDVLDPLCLTPSGEGLLREARLPADRVLAYIDQHADTSFDE